jgi:hypothetical protein
MMIEDVLTDGLMFARTCSADVETLGQNEEKKALKRSSWRAALEE